VRARGTGDECSNDGAGGSLGRGYVRPAVDGSVGEGSAGREGRGGRWRGRWERRPRMRVVEQRGSEQRGSGPVIATVKAQSLGRVGRRYGRWLWLWLLGPWTAGAGYFSLLRT
jgi:hypothetical protein